MHESRGLGDVYKRQDWWSEMVTDVVETPEFSDPGESAEQVLEYARDVIKEYVAKRLYT